MTEKNIVIAAESIKFGQLAGADIAGLARVFRHGDGSTVIGVCLHDCQEGEELRYTEDHDAILLALQVDAGDKV